MDCRGKSFLLFLHTPYRHTMRILFLGDYSNLHACLAGELEKRGHDVTVVSDGGRYMDTRRDILLCRDPGVWGTARYAARLLRLLPAVSGYDVVQMINPHFLSLRPRLLRHIFPMLRRRNGSVFLTLAGDDYHFVQACLDGGLFRFSEFAVGDTPTEFERLSRRGAAWTAPGMREYCDLVYSGIDGAMSVLPEYDMAARPILGDRLAFTNIPVDLASLPFSPLPAGGPVRLFIGMRGGMEIQKGTARLLAICHALEKEMPGLCSVTCVRNLPLARYLEEMAKSHIVLDQLYSYSPGTNGFQAMALGRVAATGAQPEFYSHIGESVRPLIPLSPLEDPAEALRPLILDPSPLAGMARQGRKIVERHNDVRIVADKFERHWNRILK